MTSLLEILGNKILDSTGDATPGGSFRSWLPSSAPGSWVWDFPHQTIIYEHLNRITSRDSDRLMVFMPPRHFKSETVTIRYPAWVLEQNPLSRVIIGAYNQNLASKFSRSVRKIVHAHQPDAISQHRKSAQEWELKMGGSLRAIGVGGGIAGYGGDLIVLDDPVKNREEANSPAYRERVYDWFTNDIWTRREPGAAIILIMTRWHEDDLAGRILNSKDGDRWEVLSLPALAEADDPLGRQPGEALCPARFDVSALEEQERVLGLDFYALYQQRPQPAEGGTFKRDWMLFIDEVPFAASRVRYWDKARTEGGGAYTVGVLMAYDGRYWYVEDVVRGRWDIPQREAIIRRTAEMDAARYHSKTAVTIFIEEEPVAGKEATQQTIRNLVGFNAWGDAVRRSKTDRAIPLAAQMGVGNVLIKNAHWNKAFVDEFLSFPSGRYKDQVDATTGAFNQLSEIGMARIGRSPTADWRG